MITGQRRIDKIIEFRETVDISPYPVIARVKNMRPVFMYGYRRYRFAESVAADMLPFIKYEASLTARRRFMSKYRAKKAGSDDEVIVARHLLYGPFLVGGTDTVAVAAHNRLAFVQP